MADQVPGADGGATPPNSLAAGGDPAPQLGADGKPVTQADPAAPQLGADGKPVTPPAADTAKPADIIYEFKAPEGMELDKTALTAFTAVAKELKLPAETAQKVVDVAVQMQQRQLEAHTKQVDAWAEEVQTGKTADGKDLPEHLRVPGGDKLPETLAVCKKAMSLGPPELKQLLNDSGFGNHPAIVRFMYSVGKAMSEDRFISGAPGAGEADPAKAFYPSMQK
ncbi:MAG: hypothetical protein ACO27H_12540 [Burkholderiaceae bacterium]